MLSDPLKLIPLIIAGGAVAGLLLKVINVQDAVLLLGAAGVVHPAGSASTPPSTSPSTNCSTA